MNTHDVRCPMHEVPRPASAGLGPRPARYPPRRARASNVHHRTSSGFSIVELLVALTISATLLAATLQAFDAAWRGYKHTTESASTHVVSRIVVHRVLAMIRTGSQFGPAPADVLNSAQNPLTSNFMEFVSDADTQAGLNRVTRLERRNSTANPGQFELWYKVTDLTTGNIIQERPLLAGVTECAFILQFEPGPRLVKATMDLTIAPNDDRDLSIGVGNDAPPIRLVASTGPRQLQ
ncbi:MAG TPA: prepilin-type N-terminal cleavage/methylation domain-containing protein [Phycisphaerales bacterium]|nr:prepilin-type N-terminal cleavage/methylation domain-containing protein [Phycisphaerales bacterium]